MLNITAKIKIIDLAIVIKDILIIADIHIGYEEVLNKQGILIPRFQFNEIIQRLERIFANVKNIKTIIVNGDIKHEFGAISDQEWRHTLKLIDFLGKFCEEIILIKGNHDKIIGPIAEKRKVRVEDHFLFDDILIIHGDKIPKLPRCKTIVIGHEHPAISLREDARKETYKCYLTGKYKGKTLIVQPSFNLVTEGTDILSERLLSPFLQQDLNNFDVYIVSDKIYSFGKLKKIKC